MSATLIDANVLLDIATADANWMAWSQDQVRLAAGRGAVYINPIIYACIARLPNGPSQNRLHLLDAPTLGREFSQQTAWRWTAIPLGRSDEREFPRAARAARPAEMRPG
jgi:hypothetical protein